TTGSPISVSSLPSATGFVIEGAAANDGLGWSVDTAGDVNDDGISDIILLAFGANHGGGIAYVIYGKNGSYSETIDLSNFNISGFQITGYATAGLVSVASAGDVDSDGINDVIIGAESYDAATSFVLYGTPGGYPQGINLGPTDSDGDWFTISGTL